MNGLYSFMLGANDFWDGWEEGDTLSPTEHVISRLPVLHGGKDVLVHDEINFCPPKPYSYR